MLKLVTILLHVAAVASTMVLSPSMLTAGTTEAVYVSDAANSTFGSIVLVNSLGEAVSIAYPSSYSLYHLPVPAATATGSGYKVQALSTNSEVLHEVSVDVMPAASLLMLENDKALYKPGQTAKFRALLVTLAQKVPVQDEPVQLTVVGPNGYTLMQSDELLTDAFGVVRFEFPVATLPLLGTYMANAYAVNDDSPAATHEVSFIVDEYVLPRFEVTALIHNSFLVADSSSGDEMISVTGQLTAMYTFGEAVRASSVNITVMMENQMFYWGWGGVAQDSDIMEPRDSYSVLATTMLGAPSAALEDLQFEVMVPRARLAGGSPLTVEVTVQDAATGEVQSGVASLPVAFDLRGLEVHLSPAHGGSALFKPGLPVEVQVELFNADGSSGTLTSEQAFLVVSSSVVDYRHTPENLVIPIDASQFSAGVMSLSFSMDAESSDCCKPNAVSADYQEYMNNTGCCITAISMWLQDSSEGGRFSSSSERTSTLCMERAYSPTLHYLDLQFATDTPTPGSTASVLMRTTVAGVQTAGADATRMDYLLLQGSSVVGSGEISLTGVAQSGHAEAQYTQGSFEVFMPNTMAGECKVVAMLYLPDNQVVTGSATANMTVAFPLTLSVGFRTQEAVPAENVALEVTIDQPQYMDTRVYLTAVDRSVELLGKRTRVDERSVLAGINRAAGEDAQAAPRAWRECFCFGRYAPILTELRETDLQLLPTDLPATCDAVPERLNADLPYGEAIRGPLGEICPRPLFSPGMCGGYDQHMDDVPEMVLDAAAGGGAGGGMQRSQDDADSRSVHVRRNFPETWLWTELLIPYASVANESYFVVPDTITSWTLEAFSSTPGIGMAATRATQSLRVFKPLFVEIRLPYSAVRGEDLLMTIVVFNYMESQQAVSVALTLPDEVEVSGLAEGLNEVHTTNSQMSTTVRVRVKPIDIGTFAIRVQASTSAGVADVIQRSLLVKPEGFVVRKVANGVIQLQEGVSSQEKALSLHVPEDAVEGSVFASITAVGDIMGPTLQGLENLLTIPSGCGEQNMMTLAPNVYVGRYLHSVGRLSADLQQRIVRNIVIGYGRQLTYQRSDGSFSAFGEQDSAGSTWLTAFTIRVFAEVHASGLAAVDPQVMIDACEWLLTLLDEDESFFQSSGMVIHQEMMGGIGSSSGHGGPIGFLGPPESPSSQPQMSETDRKVALTSFVVIALTRVRAVLEADLLPAGLDNALTQARGYLTSKMSELSEHAVYAKVLSAYSRVIAQPSASVVNEIVALATTESEGLAWRAACTEPPCYGATALDVELTGYAVMILTSQGSLGQAFLGVRWLLQQRNAGGGFISTQDTVVALKALSEYAGDVRGSADVTLSLQMSSPLTPGSASITVDDSNFDVLQRLPLKGTGETIITPGTNMSVEAMALGGGVTLVSLDLQYNMMHAEVEPCYRIEVAWDDNDNEGLIGVRPCVHMLDSCSRPDGSGMVLLNVGLFTGYAASTSSLNSLVSDGNIKKYEVEDKRVALYVDQVPSGEAYCAPFDAIMDFDVSLLQPAPSEVFEYYAPHNRGDVLTHWDSKHITSFTTTGSPPASRSPSFASRLMLWPIATVSCMIATLALL